MKPAWSLSLLPILCCAGTTWADKPVRPFSYTELSSDRRFIFVMLAPGAAEDELRGWNQERQKVIREIRDKYVRSGLYKNDGSTDPLWTVDWYAFSVDVASDGVHLVKFGGWPSTEQQGLFGWFLSPDSNDLKQEAVSFFANGRLLREYSIGELVDWPILLPKSVSHFLWLRESQTSAEGKQLEITTKDYNYLVFDLTDGSLVEKRAIATRVIAVSGAVLVMILAFAARRFVRRRRAKRAPDRTLPLSSQPNSEAITTRQQAVSMKTHGTI